MTRSTRALADRYGLSHQTVVDAAHAIQFAMKHTPNGMFNRHLSITTATERFNYTLGLDLWKPVAAYLNTLTER